MTLQEKQTVSTTPVQSYGSMVPSWNLTCARRSTFWPWPRVLPHPMNHVVSVSAMLGEMSVFLEESDEMRCNGWDGHFCSDTSLRSMNTVLYSELIPSLKLTASFPLKMDAWFRWTYFWGGAQFQGLLLLVVGSVMINTLSTRDLDQSVNKVEKSLQMFTMTSIYQTPSSSQRKRTM